MRLIKATLIYDKQLVCAHFLKALLSSAEASRAARNPGHDKSTVAQSTDLVNMFITLIPRVRTVTLF